ncbi:MAG TPA: hypothetical protein VNN72_12910 [Polyangiaceae bacterium]|nr:hypothetical protein [Polyangiaceae bacterium]
MELDPEARRLLDLTREARTPNAEDKRRVERSLSRSLGLAAFSVATGAASAATAKSAPAALVLKWTLGLAVPALVVASAATYFHGRSSERGTAPVVERPVADAPMVAPAPPAEAPPKAAAGTAELAPAPAEPPAAPRTAPAPQAKKSETLEAELDLLHDAQVKRSSDPEGALALLVTHRKRYPKSVLGLEREALRVLCLCAAGRTAEAREVARRSFKNAPRSPLKASVEESCAKP